MDHLPLLKKRLVVIAGAGVMMLLMLALLITIDRPYVEKQHRSSDIRQYRTLLPQSADNMVDHPATNQTRSEEQVFAHKPNTTVSDEDNHGIPDNSERGEAFPEFADVEPVASLTSFGRFGAIIGGQLLFYDFSQEASWCKVSLATPGSLKNPRVLGVDRLKIRQPWVVDIWDQGPCVLYGYKSGPVSMSYAWSNESTLQGSEAIGGSALVPPIGMMHDVHRRLWSGYPKARYAHWTSPHEVAWIIDQTTILVTDVLRDSRVSYGPLTNEHAGLTDTYEPLLAARVTTTHIFALTPFELVVFRRNGDRAECVSSRPLDEFHFVAHDTKILNVKPVTREVHPVPVARSAATAPTDMWVLAIQLVSGENEQRWLIVRTDTRTMNIQLSVIGFPVVEGKASWLSFGHPSKYFEYPLVKSSALLYDHDQKVLFVTAANSVDKWKSALTSLVIMFDLSKTEKPTVSAVQKIDGPSILSIGQYGDTSDIAIVQSKSDETVSSGTVDRSLPGQLFRLTPPQLSPK